MNKGVIVLVPFPFTDLKGSKVRPAVVLVNKESDVILAFISTQIDSKEKLDIIIEPSTDNGLKRPSIIRISKLITLHKNLVLGEIGKIDSKIHQTLNKNLKTLFDIN
jgi:mRNA interferase MazF